MATLNLTKRPAQIGATIATRTERHGEEEIPALTIPLKNIMLDEGDINRMLGLADAYGRLYIMQNKVQMPALAESTISVGDKFKGAKVTIRANGQPLTFPGATVSRMRLAPQPGGVTALDCAVSVRPTENQHVDVLALLSADVMVSILGGAAARSEEGQGELPLPPGAAPEPKADDEGPSEFERGAKRALAEHKRRVGNTARAPRGR